MQLNSRPDWNQMNVIDYDIEALQLLQHSVRLRSQNQIHFTSSIYTNLLIIIFFKGNRTNIFGLGATEIAALSSQIWSKFNSELSFATESKGIFHDLLGMKDN